MPAASNWQWLPSGRMRNPGIVAGVHDFDSARLGIEAHKDGGHIAATGLFALTPVVLVHAGCKLIERRPGDGHGAKGRAEAGGHHGGGESFASHVGYSDQQAAVGLLDDVEVVAAHLVTGDGAEGQGIAADVGQILRQQRALDVAGSVQILLYPCPFQIALVVAGVFEGDGGLQRQPFDEVGLVDGQLAAVGRCDHQLGHALAFAILQEIPSRMAMSHAFSRLAAAGSGWTHAP